MKALAIALVFGLQLYLVLKVKILERMEITTPIKRILHASIGIFILAMLCVLALDSGWFWVPEWYRKTGRSQARSMQAALVGIARGYELSSILPPEDAPRVLTEAPGRWGFPLQYSYEGDTPTLRAAGADGKLNTEDDILQRVNITKP